MFSQAVQYSPIAKKTFFYDNSWIYYCNVKQIFTQDLLRLGVNVLWFDTDVGILQDPRPLFHGDVDIEVSSDVPP